MDLIVVIFTVIALVSGEKSGPYPASGWKPSGARLELPAAEYGPPLKRLNGQIKVLTTTSYPTTTYDYETTTLDRGYLPPTTTALPEDEAFNPLRVQGLPRSDQPQENSRNAKAARFSELEDFKSQFFASQHQLQFGSPRLGQLRAAARQQEAAQQSPENEYLPPVAPRGVQNREVENIVDPNVAQSQEATTADQDENSEEGGEEETRDEEENAGATFQGQYYILAPDNTLQRVMYRTIQTANDVQKNGFTAQLQYSPVDPVKPPIYGYNEQGQLIRLYRKK